MMKTPHFSRVENASLDPLLTTRTRVKRANGAQVASTSNAHTGDEYRTGGLKHSLHGSSFQMKLLMLAQACAYQKGISFRLATEMDEAEKFDDLFLEYQDQSGANQYYFLQAKHKQDESRSISWSHLISQQSNGEFQLKKYFESYLKIKKIFKNGALKDFVIATNIGIKDEFEKFFTPSTSENVFLEFTSTGAPKDFKLLKFKDNLNIIDANKGSALYKHLKANDHSITEALIKEFLEKLSFAVNLPNEDHLTEILSIKLKYQFHLSDNAHFIYSQFESFYWNWMKAKIGVFIKREDIDKLSKKIRDNLTWYQLSGMSLKFREENKAIRFHTDNLTLKDFLTGQSPQAKILNFVSKSDGMEVASARVQDALAQDPYYTLADSYIFLDYPTLIRLRDQVKMAYTSPSKEKRLLVIRFNSLCHRENQNDLLEDLFHHVKADAHKYILLITDPSTPILRSDDPTHLIKTVQDKTEFEDLQAHVQQALLEKKVEFQGFSFSVKDLIHEQAFQLNAEALNQLMQGESLKIGSVLPTLESTQSYYIARQLSQRRPVFGRKHFFHLAEHHQKDLLLIEVEDANEYSQLKISSDLLNKYYHERWTPNLAGQSGQADQAHPAFVSIVVAGNGKSHFAALCRKFQKYNIHWFIQSDEKFVWEQSYNSMEGIRPYFIEYTEEYRRENELIYLPRIENSVIISGNPGSGKTALLKHLAQQLKTVDPSHWVVYLNLSQLKQLEQMDLIALDSIKDFLLSEKAGPSALEKIILSIKLQAGKVSLFMDGFDELHENLRERLLNLLSHLKMRQIKLNHLYIATRPHLQVPLEAALNTLTFQIQDFSLENHQQFLESFWQEQLPNLDPEKLQLYAEHTAQFFHATPTLSKLMDTPLSLEFIAQLLQSKCQTFIESSLTIPDISKDFKADTTLFKLYQDFIELKYDTYFKRIYPRGFLEPHHKKFLQEKYMEDHGLFALHQLFPEIVFKLEKTIGTEEDYNKIGIISFKEGDHYNFFHKNIAEYHTAQALFRKYKYNKDSQLAHTIKSILLCEENRQLRYFFDHFAIKDQALDLHVAVLEENVEKIQSLLDKECHFQKREDYLLKKDTFGRRAVNLAAMHAKKPIIEYFASAIRQYNSQLTHDNPQITYADYFFIWQDLFGLTPFSTAAYAHRWEKVEEMFHTVFEQKAPHILLRKPSIGEVTKRLDPELENTIKTTLKTVMKYDDVYPPSNLYISTLFEMAQSGGETLFRFLVKSGLLKEIARLRNRQGDTLLHVVQQPGIFNFLLDQLQKEVKAKIEDKLLYQLAATKEHQEVVDDLIQEKAGTYAKDVALDIAMGERHKFTHEFLIALANLLIQAVKAEPLNIQKIEEASDRLIGALKIMEQHRIKDNKENHILGNVGDNKFTDEKVEKTSQSLLNKLNNALNQPLEDKLSAIKKSIQIGKREIAYQLFNRQMLVDGNGCTLACSLSQSDNRVGIEGFYKHFGVQGLKDNAYAGDSLIHIAAAANACSVLQFLIDENAKTYQKKNKQSFEAQNPTDLFGVTRNREQFTPLHEAIEEQAKDAALLLIENGLYLHAHTRDYSTLAKALQSGNLDIVRALIQAGDRCVFKERTVRNNAPFMFVATDNLEVIQWVQNNRVYFRNRAGELFTLEEWKISLDELFAKVIQYGREEFADYLRSQGAQLQRALEIENSESLAEEAGPVAKRRRCREELSRKKRSTGSHCVDSTTEEALVEERKLFIENYFDTERYLKSLPHRALFSELNQIASLLAQHKPVEVSPSVIESLEKLNVESVDPEYRALISEIKNKILLKDHTDFKDFLQNHPIRNKIAEATHVANQAYMHFLVGKHLIQGDISGLGLDAFYLKGLPTIEKLASQMMDRYATRLALSHQKLLRTASPWAKHVLGNFLVYFSLKEEIQARLQTQDSNEKVFEDINIATDLSYILADLATVLKIPVVAEVLGPIGISLSVISVLLAPLAQLKTLAPIHPSWKEELIAYGSILLLGEIPEQLQDDLLAQKSYQSYIEPLLTSSGNYSRVVLSLPHVMLLTKFNSTINMHNLGARYPSTMSKTCKKEKNALLSVSQVEVRAHFRPQPTLSRLLPPSFAKHTLICGPSDQDIGVQVIHSQVQQIEARYNQWASHNVESYDFIKELLFEDFNADCQGSVVYEKTPSPQQQDHLYYLDAQNSIIHLSNSANNTVIVRGVNLKHPNLKGVTLIVNQAALTDTGLRRNKDEVRSQGGSWSEKRSDLEGREYRSPGSNAEFGPEPTISRKSSQNHFYLNSPLKRCDINTQGQNYLYVLASSLNCQLGGLPQQSNMVIAQGNFINDNPNIHAISGGSAFNQIESDYSVYIDGQGGEDHITTDNSIIVAHWGDVIEGCSNQIRLSTDIRGIRSIQTTQSGELSINSLRGDFIQVEKNNTFSIKEAFQLEFLNEHYGTMQTLMLTQTTKSQLTLSEGIKRLSQLDNPGFILKKRLNTPAMQIQISEIPHPQLFTPGLLFRNQSYPEVFYLETLNAGQHVYWIKSCQSGDGLFEPLSFPRPAFCPEKHYIISRANGLLHLDFGAKLRLSELHITHYDQGDVSFQRDNLTLILLANYQQLSLSVDGNRYYRLQKKGHFLRDYCTHPFDVMGMQAIVSQDLLNFYNCLRLSTDHVLFLRQAQDLILFSEQNWLRLSGYYKAIYPTERALSIQLTQHQIIPEIFKAKAAKPYQFRYYKPEILGLRIYHNQPHPQKAWGLIDLESHSILDCTLILDEQGALIVNHLNQTWVQLENFGYSPETRTVSFAFRDAFVANAQCLLAHCDANDTLTAFQAAQHLTQQAEVTDLMGQHHLHAAPLVQIEPIFQEKSTQAVTQTNWINNAWLWLGSGIASITAAAIFLLRRHGQRRFNAIAVSGVASALFSAETSATRSFAHHHPPKPSRIT